MTDRTRAAPRILEALGSEQLNQCQIRQRTGMSALAVKSTLNAMRKRGEIVRLLCHDGVPMFRANCQPLNERTEGGRV